MKSTKSQLFYGVVALFCFCMAWSYIAFAQAPASSPSPSPAIAAAVVSSVGFMGWINSHGGFQAAVLLLMTSALAILSAIRQVCSAFDGIKPGDAIPADKSTLTLINKICIVLGKTIDFATGNPQH